MMPIMTFSLIKLLSELGVRVWSSVHLPTANTSQRRRHANSQLIMTQSQALHRNSITNWVGRI